MLFVINLLWTVAYDTLYAIVDRENYLLIGLKRIKCLINNLYYIGIFIGANKNLMKYL